MDVALSSRWPRAARAHALKNFRKDGGNHAKPFATRVRLRAPL